MTPGQREIDMWLLVIITFVTLFASKLKKKPLTNTIKIIESNDNKLILTYMNIFQKIWTYIESLEQQE